MIANPIRVYAKQVECNVRSSSPLVTVLFVAATLRRGLSRTMAQKRKADIPPNAASANNYTDSAGSAPNKRSRISKPDLKAFTTETSLHESAKGDAENGGTEFDHSRVEERAGIVDRSYYPAEMSNERCDMYIDCDIPRPIEVLSATMGHTKKAR